MKRPVLYIKDEQGLKAFLDWADHEERIAFSGWRGSGRSVREEAAARLAGDKVGLDAYLSSNHGFDFIHHPVGVRHPTLTCVNSLTHLKHYLARYWAANSST